VTPLPALSPLVRAPGSFTTNYWAAQRRRGDERLAAGGAPLAGPAGKSAPPGARCVGKPSRRAAATAPLARPVTGAQFSGSEIAFFGTQYFGGTVSFSHVRLSSGLLPQRQDLRRHGRLQQGCRLVSPARIPLDGLAAALGCEAPEGKKINPGLSAERRPRPAPRDGFT